MRLGCGTHEYVGDDLLIPVPTEPEPTEGYDPPVAASERLMVLVGEFPAFGYRGILWDARIEPNIRIREGGGNDVTITCEASEANMRILGKRIPGETTATGEPLYHSHDALSRELLVGFASDGKVRWRFVIRDEWEHQGNRLTIKGVGFTSGLDYDRVIGAPTRLNELTGTSAPMSFESGTLAGWTPHNIEANVVSGGVDGGYKVRIRGDVSDEDHPSYLEAKARLTAIPRPWGRQEIRAAAYVQLPDYGLDIEDYSLMSLVITDAATGATLWPTGTEGDPGAEGGLVTGEMNRGTFTEDPIEVYGLLPAPPFNVDVRVRLYPVDDTEWTYFDGISLFRRENTSTAGVAIDLVGHIRRLWAHFNTGRGKNDTKVRVRYGEFSGIVKRGIWWHDDGQAGPDAIEAVAGQGLEVSDYPDGNRTVIAQKRRGMIRPDIQIFPWNVLSEITYKIDPGNQRTALRATSSAGTSWGGADVGAFDTSKSGGQVIDVIVSGPSGMTPSELQAWARQRLASMRSLQATTTVLVSWSFGLRIAVGDTLPVALRAGHAGHIDWMRVSGMSPDPDCRWWAIDLGTDPEIGGL